MSFQGLASALVVLIIIGIILGLLLDAQIERMQEPETPTSEVSALMSTASPSDDSTAAGSTAATQPGSLEELERREEALNRERAAFEIRKKRVQANLFVERETLATLRQDLEQQEEALERDRMELGKQAERLDRVWNWAVLALCGAGALTIGNVAVAAARHRPARDTAREGTSTEAAKGRTAYLRPKEPSAAVRGRADECDANEAGSDQHSDSAERLWSELMGQRQEALRAEGRSSFTGVFPVSERAGMERVSVALGVDRKSDVNSLPTLE